MEINIKKLKSGAESEFEKLVTEFQNKVYSICFGVLGNSDDAMDVTQEVFVKIFRNIKKFKENSSLSTWIFRIAKNACYDFLRKKHIKFEGELHENIIDDNTELPEDIIERLEKIDVVRELIKKLPLNYRIPLLLREYEEMSYKSIGEVLEISEGTVKSRIHRAREYLLKMIIDNKELF